MLGTKQQKKNLQGLRVLLTRPAAQAERLNQELRELGGNPILLSLLEIAARLPTPQTTPTLDELEQINFLIFVSVNAVDCGLAYLPVIPSSVMVGAIGQATAERLHAAGIDPTLVPARFDSEGFLALPQVQNLRDKAILIVRGEGGRERLADGLRARGAQVRYLEVYRRVCPHWRQEDVSTVLRADVITVTSSEALENLAILAGLPGGSALLDKPLLVYHDRIAGRALELGFTLKPAVTEQPGDDALLLALANWDNVQKSMEHA